MVQGARRDLGKAAAWRRIIGEQSGSGLSVRAWCRQQSVTESAFYWWRRELVRRDAGQPLSSRRNSEQISRVRRDAEVQMSSFVPMHVAEDRPACDDPQIEIMLAGGQCIRVHGSVNRQMLTDVLKVLTSVNSTESAARSC